jgi:hypothetical protein
MSILKQLVDSNKNPIPVVHLSNSEDVDGSGASAQSSAFDGFLVRIVSIDNAIRVAVGADPTAVATSILISAFGELWLPIQPGFKVAVLGGKANVCLGRGLD